MCCVQTHYAVGHQGSLHKACQDVGRVVLVVGDAGQTGVEGHHQQGELEQWAEETSSAPGKPGLDVKLQNTK